MTDCAHPVQMHGLCAICGLDLIENSDGIVVNSSGTESPNFHILHTNPHIKVTAEEAARIGNENMERLLSQEKLSLVVDLDQTVLHATVDPSVHEWLHDSNHPLHQHTEDIHKVALHDSPHIYYVKLRPGLTHFFSQLSKIFELHVYTMGSRSYAHAVVRLFDPDGRLFQDRILSRDDNEVLENRKKLERIFPTDDRMVLVIDDRADVWPDCRNLVRVPAYTFFVGTGDINAPPGSSKIDGETGVQEHTKSTVINPNDEVLYTIERVLKCIHKRFFEEYKNSKVFPDVKDLLEKFKREIFSGCSFVFSGLLHQHSAFEEQEIWKLSQEFGADCEYDLSDHTTHLISNRIDTEKALESKEREIPAVKPEWIYESCRRWERQDWKEFELEIKVSSKRSSKKRSLAELDEENDTVDPEVDADSSFVNVPFLNAEDFEEIEKELEDLEESEDGERKIVTASDNSVPSLSDSEFSDLLNYSSEEIEGDEEGKVDDRPVNSPSLYFSYSPDPEAVKLRELQGMFPNIPRAYIVRELDRADGAVPVAIDNLLLIAPDFINFSGNNGSNERLDTTPMMDKTPSTHHNIIKSLNQEQQQQKQLQNSENIEEEDVPSLNKKNWDKVDSQARHRILSERKKQMLWKARENFINNTKQ